MSITILSTRSTSEATTGERSGSAARVAALAILGYWALSIAVIIVNLQWNPLTRQLSEYALGHQGWLQSAAFFASAITYGALAVAVWDEVSGTAGRIGVAILSYCALGSLGVGIFVTDPMNTPPKALTTHGMLHIAFGGSALILLPVAALLITRSIARQSQDTRAQRSLRRLGFLPLAGLALIWVPETMGVVPIGGWPDRILFLTYTVWLLKLAWMLTLSAHANRTNDAMVEP